jgi:hypothetical protein
LGDPGCTRTQVAYSAASAPCSSASSRSIIRRICDIASDATRMLLGPPVTGQLEFQPGNLGLGLNIRGRHSLGL